MELSTSLPLNALELLAPAKDKLQGMEAIRHGADAVYIGAPAYGARAAVPVSSEDIRELIDFAHQYQCRVYVALNTILRDDELTRAVEIAHEMYNIGADALIIQDLGLLTQDLPPIALHASTQMDNISAEKVAFWAKQGMEQVVLARELAPSQIKRIHKDVPQVRLECFVHGALCVSYSGRCYAAAAFHGRSANRGSCSQVCRLPFDLKDSSGRVLVHDKHLLSIKDLNRSEVLGELIDAGVRAFKIEGRLKDLSYVKNVTLTYHRLLDEYIASHPEYCRSSIGRVDASFTPDLKRVFNRGYTSFVHRGRGADELSAFETPKSIGPEVGKITSVKGVQVRVSLLPGVTLSNGDGFTFMDQEGKTKGFRANTAEGTLLTLPRPITDLRPGLTLHRSNDQHFERLMQSETAQRKIGIHWHLHYASETLSLEASVVGSEVKTSVEKSISLEVAQKGDTYSSVRSVLEKLGGTPFESQHIDIDEELKSLFIPRSLLTQLRQEASTKLVDLLREKALLSRGTRPHPDGDTTLPYWTEEVDYTANILNSSAKRFLEDRHVTVHQMAYELSAARQQPIMYTKHCIRYSLKQCPHLQGYPSPHKEPWTLVSTLPDDPNPVRMRIEFDCKNCQMKLFEDL